ncbi:MAG: hypothetical protein JKY42_12470 [Flavobacteriales bacterium]|nr:hypothetical protein [Flavobacteriales bacterium]
MTEFLISITANAGPDDTICVSSPIAPLSGTVTGVTEGVWSSLTGSGTFLPNDTLSSSYTFDATEIAVGFAILQLNTIGNLSCPGDSDSVRVTIVQLPAVIVGADNAICADVTGFTITGSSHTNGTASWTTSGDGTYSNSSIDNPVYTIGSGDITAGSVYLIFTSANTACTPAADSILLTINPLPTIVAGADQVVCQGTSITLSGSGGLSYTWDNGVNDGVSFVPPVGVTTYNITGTDANSCVNTSSLNITVNGLPVIVAGADQVVCEGTSITLSGSGGVSYLWDNGVSNGASFVPPVGVTTYNVTGTDANSCVNTSSLNVTVNGLPVIVAGADQVVCQGTSITLLGSGGLSYSWDNGVSNGASFVPPVGVTTYNVAGTDANSCVNTSSLNVTVNGLPVIIAGADQVVCQGTSITLSGSGGLSYTWDNGVSNGVSFVPPVGVTTYNVTGTDANSCVNTSSLNVTVDPAPTVNAGSGTEICSDQNSFTASGASATNGTILWASGGDGTFVNATVDNSTYNFGSNDILGGVVNLTMTVSGSVACGAISDVISITITSAPTANASGDWIICEDQSNYTIVGAVSSNGTVLWTTSGDGTFVDATTDNPTYTFGTNDTTNGLATLTMTVTGNGSCSPAMDVMNLTITDSPSISAGPNDTVCADNSTISLNGSVTVASGGV